MDHQGHCSAAMARVGQLCYCSCCVLATDSLRITMTITLQGLTHQQHQLAELLWNCDSQEDVEQLKQSLPVTYRKDAETIHQLMIAAVFDDYTDITEDVKALIDSMR